MELAGALAHAEVPRLLERTSALVVPSVIAPDGDRDAVPVVALEAMAMEVPVIASDLPGLCEVTAPDRAVEVRRGDAEALAEALAEMAGLPPQRRVEMGRCGRAYVELSHDLRRQVRELRRLFAQAGAF